MPFGDEYLGTDFDMNSESDLYQSLELQLANLGYARSAMGRVVKTEYGQEADLVVYEGGKPNIVFELKTGANFPSETTEQQLRFHPAIRQAQSFSKALNAPFFAVFNGSRILWFQTGSNGRPELLQYPVLPAQASSDQDTDGDERASIARLFFQLADIGRTQLPPHEVALNVGIAVYARLLWEKGNATLEHLLSTGSSTRLQLRRFFEHSEIAQIEPKPAFFTEAVKVLDSLRLVDCASAALMAAADEFIQASVVAARQSIFRLPNWLSSIMAQLAQPVPNSTVLDIYSNFGDGIAALSSLDPTVEAWSITSNSTSYIWDKTKRLTLGLETGTVVQELDIDEGKSIFTWMRVAPSRVLVAPPFGRNATGSSKRNEDIYLQRAVEWVQPEGRVVAIVPEGFLFDESRREFRGDLLSSNKLIAVISLDQYVPGSSIKASILVLDKVAVRTDYQILMARIRNIGEDNGPDFSASTVHTEKVAELIEAFGNHVHHLHNPKGSGFWSVSSNELRDNSWSVDRHDPTRQLELVSTVPTLELWMVSNLFKGSPLTLDQKGDLQVIGPSAVRMLHIDPGKLDRTTKERLTRKPVTAQRDDIVIHAVGQYRGHAALVGPELAGTYVSRNIIVVRADPSRVLPAYLAVVLNSEFAKRQYLERTTGSVLVQLSIASLSDLVIPVPAISEQRRIVNAVRAAQYRIEVSESQVTELQLSLEDARNNLQEILEKLHEGGEVQ